MFVLQFLSVSEDVQAQVALPPAGSITCGPAPAAGRPQWRELGAWELLTGTEHSGDQSWYRLVRLPSLHRHPFMASAHFLGEFS